MDLVKCPFCGKEIESDSFYCDLCGEELKICPSGHGFKKGKVCSDCGTKLVEAKSAGNTPTLQPTGTAKPVQNTQPVSPQPTYASQQPAAAQPVSSQPAYASQQPVNTPEATVRNVQSTNAPESTIRYVSAEPKYLVSKTLNARLELKNGAIIGRRAGDYVNVFGTQGYVSGTHARVQKNAAGTWEIVDLNSTNGTFLNGQKLFANQPATFKLGDTIAFYDLKFTVSEQ